jgi:hypothetical protein
MWEISFILCEGCKEDKLYMNYIIFIDFFWLALILYLKLIARAIDKYNRNKT